MSAARIRSLTVTSRSPNPDHIMRIITLFPVLFSLVRATSPAESFSGDPLDSESSPQSSQSKTLLFTIDGRVQFPSGVDLTPEFLTSTRVIVNHGEYLAFLQRDGSFAVTNLPAGSYLVEVTNPDFFYEPVRVDITSKGKTRARKVNYIQSSAVHQLNYPLRFKAKNAYKYFQVRETWKITDALFNPMVMMMVLPLLLLLVLPKMMNAADPETQREMQNMQMPKYDMPELSEMMTSLFKGSGAGPSTGRSQPPLRLTGKKKL